MLTVCEFIEASPILSSRVAAVQDNQTDAYVAGLCSRVCLTLYDSQQDLPKNVSPPTVPTSVMSSQVFTALVNACLRKWGKATETDLTEKKVTSLAATSGEGGPASRELLFQAPHIELVRAAVRTSAALQPRDNPFNG